MHLRISNLYNCGCDECKIQKQTLNLGLSDDFKQLLNVAETAFKALFNKGGYKPEDLKTEKAYKDLINETNAIFEKTILDNVIEGAMLESLQKDIYLFSGLKTHAQLFEASRLLLDEKGQQKSFQAFSRDFEKINNSYNKNYLNAEYDYAVGTAQSIARWETFSDDEETFLLQYRTDGGPNVRVSHDALNRTTLPKSDPFWNSYTPKNGWNCHCMVVQVLADKYTKSNSEDSIAKGEKATTQIGKDGKNRLEIFRYNPGKEKVIFPPAHPYGKVKGTKEVKPIILTMFNKPNSDWKVLKSYKNGGTIESHRLVDKEASDYKSVKQCCNHFAKNGAKTEILPKVHFKSEEYKTIYQDLIGTKYEGKCPDFRVNGKYYELEGFVKNDGNDKASKMLSRGVKQSSRVVIEDDGSTDNHLKKLINFRIKEGQEIEEVWVKNNETLRKVY